LSAEEKRSRELNREINNEIRNDTKKQKRTAKLLLLGAGESGKSTFAKQMKILHLKGFTQTELLNYKPIIHANTLESMQTLVNGCIKFGYDVNPNNKEIAEKYVKIKPLETEFTTKELQEIKALWGDPSIQKTFSRSNELQLPDVATFLFDNIERISAPNYIPDQNDCLRCRARTTGIIETQFEVKNLEFRLVDVGGQRSERKKWLSQFQDVMALLFCVSLSEYDLTLWEDEKVNRMHESLELFEATTNSKWFTNTSKILFLNKSDIFQEKIARKDLKCCFPDYNGGCDFLNATHFIEQKFQEKNQTKTPIYTHITCATNTENISFVFNAVRDIILNQSLESSGFVAI